MATTMKDLVRHTGLALGTISKFFNGGRVKESNRLKIEEAIKELNYEINETARSLKTNKSYTVGVVIPQLKNTYNTSIIEFIQSRLRQIGYGTIVVCDDNDSQKQKECVKFLISKRVDLLIIIPAGSSESGFKDAHDSNIPIIVVDQQISDDKCDVIIVNNRQICCEAAARIIGCGHKKILIVAAEEMIYTAEERVLGCLGAFANASLECDGSLIIRTKLGIDDVKKTVAEKLSERKDITAIFALNYECTLGSILAVNELGLVIPDDISFFGFDNLDLARIVRPKLYMVEQPINEIAEKTVEKAIERLYGKENGKKEVIILNTAISEGQSLRKI